MKYMKRADIYEANNVTFDPKKIEAYSYGWWRFVACVDGLVVFNNYRYSVSTAKHQFKVRGIMSQLGIKIDIYAPFPQGITALDMTDRATIIQAAEENLCAAFLESELKRQDRNERARQKRAAKRAMDQAINEFSAKRDGTK